MTPAEAANEYRHNLGPDFTLADAYDLDYLDVEEADELEDEKAARQALNLKMAEWYGIS